MSSTSAKAGGGSGDDEMDPNAKDPQKVLKNNRVMKKIDRQTGSGASNGEGEGSDNDVPTKKPKICRSTNKSCREEEDDSSSEEEDDSSSDSEDQAEILEMFGSKARSSSEEEEESDTDKTDSDTDNEVEIIYEVPAPASSKGRKNVRKVIEVKDLQVTTKEAAEQEETRKQRLAERQILHNKIFKPSESDKLEPLVLDFNSDTKEAVVSVHPTIVTQLKPHQAKGIKFMWDNCFESLEANRQGGCILAHCMGLGKTLQSVAFVHTLITQPKTGVGVRTVLVICPLSTVENWVAEFRKWTLNVPGRVDVHRLWEKKDDDNERFRSLQLWHKHGGVGIIHYEGFRNLIDPNPNKKKPQTEVQSQIVNKTLVDPGPDLVICDEGHLLKNADSLIYKAVTKVKTRRRIFLTGTPMQNNLTEYHTMMSFVNPHLLGDIKEFRNRFANPIANGQHKESTSHDVALMKNRTHVLHKLLEGCVQRLDYKYLTSKVPPKDDYALLVNLTEKQKDLYHHCIKSLSNSKKLLRDYPILNKICTHPLVLTYKTQKKVKTQTPSNTNGEPDQKNGNNASEDNLWYKQFFENDEEMLKIELSGKMTVLMEILRAAESVGDKVLIFSQYLTTLDLIEKFLAELDQKAVAEANNSGNNVGTDSTDPDSKGRYRPKIDYFRINGRTKSHIRQARCDAFNDKQNTKAKAFLISIKAGGVGINLHGANRVVIFDASWNPAQDLQAIFRVYRFGQTKPSYVYRLLARGTMEEKIYNRQVVKLSLSSRVVDEQQTERHYHYEDLQKMYHFERNDPTERPIPIVPKDKLLGGLLLSHEDCIFSYLEHDSLLENKEEEELTDEAKKIAWEEYNIELALGTALGQDFTEGNSAVRACCFYTMNRLRQLNPSDEITLLAATVQDLMKVFHLLIAKYHELRTELTTAATPNEQRKAVESFKRYANTIRETYREQLNIQDINYLSKTWIELLVLALNSDCTNGEGKLPIIQLKSGDYVYGHGFKSSLNDMRDLMNAIRLIGATSFTRFNIREDGLNCDPNEWRKAFKEFIELVGKTVTFLCLDSVPISIADVRRLVFNDTPELSAFYIGRCHHERDEAQLVERQPTPKMHRIKIIMPQFQPVASMVRFGYNMVEFVLDLITTSENLEYISAKVRHDPFVRDLEDISSAILRTLPKHSLWSQVENLRTLKISIKTPTDLRNLAQLGQRLRLNILTIIFRQESRLVEQKEVASLLGLFYDFLKTQAPTLLGLNLDLEDVFRADGAVLRVPLMENLLNFKVTRTESKKLHLEFDGATLTENIATFPSLTRLAYQHPKFQNHGDINLDNDLRQLSQHGVTRLKIAATAFNFVKFSSALFPAVTDFHVTVDPPASGRGERDKQRQVKKLTQVWVMWPALTKLHLCLKVDLGQLQFNLDELLTGVDPKEARKSVEDLKLKPSSPVTAALADLRRLVAKYNKNHSGSICDLHQLKEFTLESKSRDLSDVGVFLGLALTPKLKRVTIHWIHELRLKNNISDDCRGFLQAVFGPDAEINI